MKRREFNKALALLPASGAMGSLALLPTTVHAVRPDAAFTADTMDDALNALYGTTELQSTDAVTFKVPDIAENGAVVPVRITANLDKVEHVALLVEANPSPLAATFEIARPTATTVGTRIKMGQTSPITACIRADGRLYKAVSTDIKVTIGGCGG